jgi:hypothetical protein
MIKDIRSPMKGKKAQKENLAKAQKRDHSGVYSAIPMPERASILQGVRTSGCLKFRHDREGPGRKLLLSRLITMEGFA